MKPRTPLIVTLIIAVSLISGAFYMFLQNFNFISNPIYLGTIAITILLLLINNSLNSLIDSEKFKLLTDSEKSKYLEIAKIPFFNRLWDDAFKKSKEEETGEIGILDHGYDGIQELDNQLPKWYIGLFAVTIVYGVVYFTSYIFTDFAHAEKEYDEEYKTQLAAIAEYEKTVPDATIETAEYNESDVAEGKEIFQQICVTCHKEGGVGLSGPNLTDDYWINQPEKDLYKNIFYMVWNGSPNDATMRSFYNTEELKGNQIKKVASYVYSININAKKNSDGTSEGKEKQGTLASWAKASETEATQEEQSEGK